VDYEALASKRTEIDDVRTQRFIQARSDAARGRGAQTVPESVEQAKAQLRRERAQSCASMRRSAAISPRSTQRSSFSSIAASSRSTPSTRTRGASRRGMA
jgi:hypothetical protein